MAAPTVSLYVPTVSATRMAPCPVSARLDLGAIQKSIRNATYTWSTVNTPTALPAKQIDNDNLDGDETADNTTAQTFTGDNWVDVRSNSDAAIRTNGILIFPNVTIPSGKAIFTATLEVYAGTNQGARCTIYAEDVDSAANLTTTADINGRTKTTASVEWDGGAWVDDEWQSSPNLATVVQEWYDRTGNPSSDNLALILEAKSDNSNLGRFNSYVNSDGTDFAAKLTIEYADAPLSNEYKLGTTLINLTDGQDTSPSNIIIRENGTIIPEGTVGSLAAGSWGQSGGELYIRLSDDADPEVKATDYIDITYDVTLSGQGGSTNVGGATPGWTVTTGSEYTLDTDIPALAANVPSHSRIRIKEGSGLSGAHLERGTAGSLAAGEFDIVHETLHVRLSDSSNPDSASASDVVLEYELYPSGLHVAWEVDSSGSGVSSWASRYRYSTDPRPELDSQQIDHAGKQTSGNGPCGMSYAWCFDVADTYTISATVTNTAGDSTTETTSGIVVAADSRTEYTVAASGGDDTSLASLIGTVGASTNNVKIILEDGHTENFTSGIDITGNNWWITTETASGTKPILNWSDTTPGSLVFWTLSGENFVAERVQLSESSGITGKYSADPSKLSLSGFVHASTNQACVSCDILGNTLPQGSGGFRLGGGFSPRDCLGALSLNCTSQATGAYYAAGPQGGLDAEIYCCLGGEIGPSDYESGIRSLPGSSFWNVAWSQFTGDQTKSNLRWAAGSYHNQYADYGVDGDNWTGEAGGGDTVPAIKSIRIESSKFTGVTSASALIAGITEGVEGAFVANNISSGSSNAQMPMGNGSTGTGQGLKKWGITKAHNTAIAENGYAGDLVGGGTTSGEQYHAINRVVNNLFIHEDAADLNQFFLDIGDGIATFDANVWPATATNLAAFARRYFSGSTDPGDNIANLTAWNALSYVGTDTETDVTLDADLIPDSPTTVTTEPGVHYDYYGNARASTSYAGAVIAANPSSGGGSSRNLLLLGVG